MQYSFSYFYFMMQEANEFNATQYWYSIDTDHSECVFSYLRFFPWHVSDSFCF